MILKINDIRHERSNEAPVLNFDKIFHRQSLNKKCSIHVGKYMVFKALKK